MGFTWFSRSDFVSVDDTVHLESAGTPRRGLEKIRRAYESRIREIDGILATSGPEDAAVLAQQEIAEAHPDGVNRHCNCSHTVKIYATPRPAGDTSGPPTPEVIDRTAGFFSRLLGIKG